MKADSLPTTLPLPMAQTAIGICGTEDSEVSRGSFQTKMNRLRGISDFRFQIQISDVGFRRLGGSEGDGRKKARKAQTTVTRGYF